MTPCRNIRSLCERHWQFSLRRSIICGAIWALAYIKKLTKEADDRVVELEYEQGTLKQSVDGKIEKSWVENGIKLGISTGMTSLQGMEAASIYTNEFLPGAK